MSLLLPFRENAGGVGGRVRVLGYREAFLTSVGPTQGVTGNP